MFTTFTAELSIIRPERFVILAESPLTLTLKPRTGLFVVPGPKIVFFSKLL